MTLKEFLQYVDGIEKEFDKIWQDGMNYPKDRKLSEWLDDFLMFIELTQDATRA
jgi:hypothetical protein